jgi:hypothetical protein
MSTNVFERFLQSPANWSGIALATAPLAWQALATPLWGGWLLAPLGYAVGFGIAGLWFGFPRLRGTAWDALEFDDQGDARQAMEQALSAVRGLVKHNPEDRLSPGLQARVLALCEQLQQLLAQWDRSKGQLSLEDSFQARHIVLRYLPDALRSYLSIPPRYARTRVLENGRTAEDSFKEAVDDLSGKVLQLTEDLARQDAEAFLNHSRFLAEKFKGPVNPLKDTQR